MEFNPIWIVFCIIIPLVGVAIFVWGFLSERRQRARRIGQAKAAYEDSLSALQQDPQSEDAFQKALRLGRNYADLVTFARGFTFDEVTLLDQLNAARPGETPLTSPDEAGHKAGEHPRARELAHLEELRQGGTLTAAEYHERLDEILDG